MRPNLSEFSLTLFSNNITNEGYKRCYSYRGVNYEVHTRSSENGLYIDDVLYEIASMRIKRIISSSTEARTAVAEENKLE